MRFEELFEQNELKDLKIKNIPGKDEPFWDVFNFPKYTNKKTIIDKNKKHYKVQYYEYGNLKKREGYILYFGKDIKGKVYYDVSNTLDKLEKNIISDRIRNEQIIKFLKNTDEGK